MSSETQKTAQPITPAQPAPDASAQDWVAWFWADFLPAWVAHTTDHAGIGLFDVLDENAQPVNPERRTILAQARLLFTFSHLALQSDTPAYHEAARILRATLPYFRKAPGLYRRAITNTGEPIEGGEEALAFSYDQSFVILGLSTWAKLHPEEDVTAELEECWSAVETVLTDSVTGQMLEHDGLDDPAADDAPNRAQNPHMHLFEAALQAFEMTENPVWLARAAKMRAKGLEYFFDTESGTITEFLAPDLSVLPGRAGEWREIGHQCEWAWLLIREAELGGDPASRAIADRLLAFADAHGFASEGPMKGAAFDAVSCDTSWREEKFLLWPQTEVIKAFVVRPGAEDFAQAATDLGQLIFRMYFAGRAAYVNQLDADGAVVWSDGLSRLHYHTVLALTEGARAGLWPKP